MAELDAETGESEFAVLAVSQMVERTSALP
jgi:hypothetical protein